jgi:hypothetical protein
MTYTTTFTDAEHDALCQALMGGALRSRQDQLTELLRVNRDYTSTASCIEREIEALNRAAMTIATSPKDPA